MLIRRTAAALVMLAAATAHAQLVGPMPADPKNPEPVGDVLFNGKPKIEFETITNDLGKILDTAPKPMKFKFKNAGGAPLLISDVHATCGCTVPQLAKRQYNPGEEGVIDVTYNPHGKRGKQNQRVTITSNDPNAPSFVLNVEAEVVPLVAADPAMVALGQVPKGEGKTVSLTLTSREPKWELKEASFSSSKFLAVKTTPMAEVDVNGEKVRQMTIEVTLKPEVGVGRVQEELRLEPTDTRYPTVRLPVMAQIDGDLLLAPARLSLGVVDLNSDFKGEMKLNSRSGKKFNVVSITQSHGQNEFDPVEFAVRAQPRNANAGEASDSFNIIVSGKAPATSKRSQMEFTVKTDVVGEEEIKVPVYLVVRDMKAGMTPVQPPNGVTPVAPAPSPAPAPAPAKKPGGPGQ